jgi:hypothetical protein
MTRGAGMAQHEGRGHKGLMVEKRQWKNWTRDDFVWGTPKELKFEKGHQAQQKCNSGIRNRGLKQQLHLGNEEKAQQEKRQ